MREITPIEFLAAFRPNRTAFHTDHRPDEILVALMTDDGQAGGAMILAGDRAREAGMLWSHRPGAGAEVLAELVRRGARRLDATGEGLRAYYERQGWHVTRTYEWDDSLAAPGWDYAANGRPNIYQMEI